MEQQIEKLLKENSIDNILETLFVKYINLKYTDVSFTKKLFMSIILRIKIINK